MPAIPLRYRLPNPPAVFVGRDSEATWVAEAVRRGPVTVVVGPGGLGKSALVLAALHRKHKKRLSKTLFVSLGPTVSGAEIGQEILRALAEAEHLKDVDWAALAGDPDAVVEALLDLAENGSWWIVLDDLHYGDPADARRLLQQLSRYARNSKWIVTSRMDPRLEDSGQVLTLGGMAASDLEGLARALASLPDEAITRALHVSGGSPWLLQQCIATGRSDAAVTRESLLAELPSEGRLFLEALSVVSVPLPIEVIAGFVEAPTEAQLSSLERRGLIERSPAGIRIHDVVRSVLRSPGADVNTVRWSDRAARALAAHDDPDLQIDAIRMFLELGLFEDAAQLLDRRGDALMRAGYALRLWKLLEPVSDDRLARWRLRCAADLGNPTVLGKVREPQKPDIADRVAWAQTLYMQGQLAQAAELGAELSSELRGGDQVELELAAGLLYARCLALLGERGRALRQLDLLPQRNADTVALRDVEVAMCLAGTPQGSDAVRMVEVLRAGLAELSPQVREEVAAGIAEVYRQQGRLGDAAELLRVVRATPRGGALSLFLARRVLWLKADVDLTRGELGAAREELAQLAPFIRSASLLRPEIVATRAALSLALGDLRDLDAQLADTAAEAALFGARSTEMRIAALRVELDCLLGRVSDVDPPSVASKNAEMLRLRLAAQRARNAADGEGIEEELARVAAMHDAELVPLARATLARYCVLRGESERAVQEVAAAVREAATSGHAVREAEVREAWCEVLLLAGRTSEVAPRAEELAQLAGKLGSRRFERAAQLFVQLAQERPRWATLEQLALESSVAPVTARRAQLLLGGDPPHDVLDRTIVEHLRAGRGWAAPEVFAAPSDANGWLAGWGLDAVKHAAWLPDGSAVDFSKRTLHWRLLHTLAEHAGQASKERLVLTVWEEPEYHPLKHDARLQVAIRKLRELLEDDPGKPERIVTTEEGYALAGPVRRVTA